MRSATPYARPSLGALGSIATHLVVAAIMSFFSRDECLIAETACIAAGEDPAVCREQYDECKGIPKTYDLVEFDLPEPEPEKPPEPEPEPEPEKPPEPTPEPVVKPEVEPAKLKTPKPDRAVKPAPVSDKPESDEPPPPFRIDESQTTQNGNSAVTVNTGTPGGTPGGTGDPNSKGKGSRPKDATVGDGTAAPWEPRGELYIRDLPQVLSVPQEQCAAVQELGIEGVVILTVQVRRDGTIKEVKITKDIGHGCGKVAAKALRRARFKPAVATNGQPADFELRYEYEFQLQE
jgi:protein TonB